MAKTKGIIRRIQSFMDSPKGRTYTNYIYSWGAAIVILGTLFKLTHIPGANLMLFVGMGAEVIVFFFSAFERPFEIEDDEEMESTVRHTAASGGGQPIIINGPIVAGGSGTGATVAAQEAVSFESEENVDGPIVIGGAAPAATANIATPQVAGGYAGAGVTYQFALPSLETSTNWENTWN